VRIITEAVLVRITSPEVSLEDYVDSTTLNPQAARQHSSTKRERIPTPSVFAISLAAYVQRVAGECPLCGHVEDEEGVGEEKSPN